MSSVLAQRLDRLVDDHTRLRIRDSLLVRVGLAIDTADLVHPASGHPPQIRAAEHLHERSAPSATPGLESKRAPENNLPSELDLEDANPRPALRTWLPLLQRQVRGLIKRR